MSAAADRPPPEPADAAVATPGSAPSPADDPSTAPGWILRALLAPAVVAVVAVALVPWPGPVVALVVAVAAVAVLASPGGYATGGLVLAVAVGVYVRADAGASEVHLAAQAALLPLVHVAAALAGAVPTSARIEWPALRPSLGRVTVAAGTAVVLAAVAAGAPVAAGAGGWLGIVTVALAAVVVAGLLIGRHRPRDTG